MKGTGNQQDYGMRIYDPRVGRFLSTDPLQKKFAWLTPYQFAGNSPIRFIDLDGLEPLDYSWNWQKLYGWNTKWNYSVTDVYDKWSDQVWSVMQYPNDNRIYYWQPYDGSHGTFSSQSKNADGTWNGRWVGFKREETNVRERTAEMTRGMSMFFAINIAGAAATGGAFYVWLAEDALEELAGVPIPDGPLDLMKAGLKKEVKKEAVGEVQDLVGFRKDHILNRHRAGSGKPGKTEFPSEWTDEKIIAEVNKIANDRNAPGGVGKWESPYKTGTVDGVEIRVDFYPKTHERAGQVSTAYPTNTQANPPKD